MKSKRLSRQTANESTNGNIRSVYLRIFFENQWINSFTFKTSLIRKTARKRRGHEQRKEEKGRKIETKGKSEGEEETSIEKKSGWREKLKRRKRVKFEKLQSCVGRKKVFFSSLYRQTDYISWTLVTRWL